MFVQQEAVMTLVSPCIEYPLQSLLGSIALLCAGTRLWTGYRFSQIQAQDGPQAKEPAILPYWVPYIGHVFSYLKDSKKLLRAARDATRDGIYTVRLAGAKHYIIPMPSLAKEIFAQRSGNMTTDDFIFWTFRTVLGDDTLPTMPDLHHISHNLLNPMLTPSTVAEQSTRMAEVVGQTMSQLISFTTDRAKQQPWEHSAGVSIHDDVPAGTMAEVSLFELVTRWVGYCANPVIMGQAFVDKNPTLMNDILEFDEQVPLFLMGVPPVTAALKRAKAAQRRIIAAVQDWDDALYAVTLGKDPGPGWGDMRDVSSVMRSRCLFWRKEQDGKRASAAIAQQFGFLWATHTNSNIMIFWVLTHVYADTSLLASIRAEVAPHVTISNGDSKDPKLSIDHAALNRHCSLLKSTIYETMRFDLSNAAFKTVRESLTITESVEDAVRLRGPSTVPRSYILKPGYVVCVANDPMQSDGRIWPNPEQFKPERFLEPDLADEKKTKASMQGKLFNFGGGSSMCKGRIFAEKEMMICVAAMVTLWDFELIPNKYASIGVDGKLWQIKKGIEVGAPHPVGPVVVKVKRRDG